ncbi:MAG: Uridylate kinase [candidate division WS6 bacterium OLB20]|uniref:Uridylate kinase n=1 Tax=candidate division WS6 bacterium OLB20 TaxID=1617426 RepID=A0A136LW30_9BACT|nr:MAG: Uridylate kinase [candidate division WS6 bacterium OLB20]
MEKVSVIKLGGSMVSKGMDNLFDFAYLARLKDVLLKRTQDGEKFFIVLGGGYLMRMYRDMAREAGVSDHTQLHWIGTTVNVLHGEIVRAYLSDHADDGVYKYDEYYSDEPLRIEKSFKIGGGGRPGHSGDVDAILAAKKLGADRIYSLKNVDAVYDKDPSKFDDAIRVPEATWDDYFAIIGNKKEHEPGGNYPIDPVAAGMAQESGLEFVILDGKDLPNFEHALNGEQFTGTIVSD